MSIYDYCFRFNHIKVRDPDIKDTLKQKNNLIVPLLRYRMNVFPT